jgi:phosphoglucosamine mutase
MGEFFGTDGIRGVAGRFPLDSDTIARIGYSLVEELRLAVERTPSIVSGRDTRESGSWIEGSLAAGVNAAGGTIRSAGVITTPGVAYLARTLPADAGVVISASHNSFEDNGIKIFGPTGRKLSDALEQAIERDLKSEMRLDTEKNEPRGDLKAEEQLRDRYFHFLRDEAGSGLDLAGVKLVVDCAEGASFDLAPRLFRSLGAAVEAIHVSPNGRNINLGCGSLHPDELATRVVSTKADLGIAFDGDADRLILVDADGNLLDGDCVLFILAEHLQRTGRLASDRVVATVMSNLGLEVALREKNVSLVRTSVGDKYVLDELLAGGGSLGGEQSGHIIFPEISLAGDGMITAIEVLRVMTESGRAPGELAKGMQRFPQLILNVSVARKPPIDSVPELRQAIASLDEELKGDGRLLVRYSGTENVLRIMIEGRKESLIQEQAGRIADIVRNTLG